MNPSRARLLPPLVLVAMVAAAALRAWHLDFGLPAVYNPDEVAIMNRAVALGPNGLNPRNFLYPSLYFYALFAWEGLWFLVGRVLGVFGSMADFERAYFLDPTSIFVAGRLLSVVAGVATVWATWRVGARVFGDRAGQVAACLLAVAPLAVRDAHYVKHDVPVTLFVVLAVAAAAAALESGRPRSWAWAGLWAGLAMSTHYYALFVLAPVMGAAILGARNPLASERRGSMLRTLGLIGGTAVVAFVITSPFLLVEIDTTVRDIVANRQIVMDRATDSGGAFASLGYYAAWLASDGAGPLTAMLAAAGLVATIRGGLPPVILVLSFPVVFLLFIANTIPASRYLNPVLPFVAVLAGGGASLMHRRDSGTLRWISLAVVAAAVAMAAAASVRTNAFLGQADTRTLARQWIEQSVPDGTSILVQPYSVPLRASRAALEEALTHHLGDTRRASVKFQRQLALDPYPSPAYRLIFLGTGGLDVDRLYVDPATLGGAAGLEALRPFAVTYVILKQYNVADPSTVPLSGTLQRQARLVASFSPYRSDADRTARAATPPFLHNTDVRLAPALERPGPIVQVWRLE